MRRKQHRHNLDRKLVELDNEITEKSNCVGHYQSACRQEARKLNAVRKEQTKLGAIVRDFENNNEAYIKIRNIIEEMARGILSNPKVLMRYAILSLVETMKKDPNRYGSLIYNGTYSPITSRTGYIGHNSDATDIYGHRQQNSSEAYFSEGCINMIIENAEEVFTKLVKEWTCNSIDKYSNSITSLLPSLPPPYDKD